MKKKLLGLLIVLCLVVAMIPILANAEPMTASLWLGTTQYTITQGDDPLYFTTTAAGVVTQSTTAIEDTYNLKLEFAEGTDAVPTLYARDAFIGDRNSAWCAIQGVSNDASKFLIVVERVEAPRANSADFSWANMLQWNIGDLEIRGYKGDQAPTDPDEWGRVYNNSSFQSLKANGKTVTFNKVNGSIMSKGTDTREAVNAKYVVFNGGTLLLQSKTTGAINGSSKVTVNSGDITLISLEQRAINGDYSADGLVVNGGTLTAKAGTYLFEGAGTPVFSGYRNAENENIYYSVCSTDVDGNEPTNFVPGAVSLSGMKYLRVEAGYTATVTGGTADKAKYPAGATVILTPGAAPAGQSFDGWASEDVTVADDNTFIMPAGNVTVEAKYVYKTTLKLLGAEHSFVDGTPVYLKSESGALVAATDADYNVKLAYDANKVPTIYLKNADLSAETAIIDTLTNAEVAIVTEAASTLFYTNDIVDGSADAAASNDKCGAIVTSGKVNFSGDAKLTLKGNGSTIYGAAATAELIFNDANVEVAKTNKSGNSGGWYDNAFGGNYSAITFNGGKATISSTRFVLLNGTTLTVDDGADVTVNSNNYTWNAQTIRVKDGSFYVEGSNSSELLKSTTVIVDENGVFEAKNTSTGANATISVAAPTLNNVYAVVGADKETAAAFDTASTSITGKYFKAGKAYDVTVTDGTAQSVGAAAATIKAFVGDTVTLTPGTAPAGQVPAGWTVTSNNATLNGSSFVMPAANVAVKANFGVAGGITIGSTEYTVNKGGAAIYFKTDANGVVTVAGDENDYNLKLVYADEEGAVPTLYLKGANLDAAIKSNVFSAGATKIVVLTDSTVSGAISWTNGNLTIEGPGKLALSKTITTTGVALTFKNANIELKTGTAVGLSGKDITFNGGKFVFESTNSLISDWSGATGTSRTILVTGNAQVTATSANSSAIVLANNNASFVVESGHVKLISNGDADGTAATDGWGHTLRGSAIFKINGGTFEVIGNEFTVYGSSGVKLDLTENANYFAICANNVNGTGAVEYTTTDKLTQYNSSFGIKYFKIAPAYTITVNGATASSTKASAGAEITLTPVLPVGKKLDSWTVDAGSTAVTIVDNKFVMPEGNVSITANYVDDPLYDGNPLEIGFWFAGYKQMVTRGETYYLITDASGAVTATGATADNYNIKIEYEFGKAPVISLRGAYIKGSYGAIINNNQSSGNLTDAQRADKVVIVVEDELGNATSAVPSGVTADSYLVSYILLSKGDLEIQGPGKLVVDKAVAGETTIAGKIQAGGDLTFTDADVQLLCGSLKGTNITFDGGKVDATATGELVVSVWQTATTILVKDDAQVSLTSTDKAAMHIVGADAALQIDSGSLKLKSTATGTNSENAALKMSGGAKFKMNGGTLEISGTVAVVTGDIAMELNGTFDAICANNAEGTGAVAYKDTTLKQYNSSFQLKYFKIQPGTGSAGDDDGGNTGTHTHSTTKVRGKAASCTANGIKEHYKCSCGKFFEDKAAKKEIKNIDTWKVIKATGHKDADKDGICETCKKSAQTSDNSFTALWVTLLTVSAMGLCVTFVYNKKMRATK